MKISGEKIRAARALLNWSIRDLGSRIGMTDAAISKIENGITGPKPESMEAIVSALSAEGIVFTANGVERLQNAVLWLPDYLALLDDILKQKPAEALFMNADDAKSSLEVVERVYRLREAGVKMRFLIPPGIDHISGKPSDYRRSPLLAARDVTVIYGRRIGFWTPDGIMLLVSDFLSEDYRKQFEVFWQNGEEL